MKPVVRYIDVGFCVVGVPARIIPLDHRSSLVRNREWTTTTPVQSMTWRHGELIFETLNTIYIPVDERDQPEESESEQRDADRSVRV